MSNTGNALLSIFSRTGQAIGHACQGHSIAAHFKNPKTFYNFNPWEILIKKISVDLWQQEVLLILNLNFGFFSFRISFINTIPDSRLFKIGEVWVCSRRRSESSICARLRFRYSNLLGMFSSYQKKNRKSEFKRQRQNCPKAYPIHPSVHIRVFLDSFHFLEYLCLIRIACFLIHSYRTP